MSNIHTASPKLSKELFEVVKKLSPSLESTDRINKDIQNNFKQKVKKELENIDPLTYKQYRIHPDTGAPFKSPLRYGIKGYERCRRKSLLRSNKLYK